MESSGATPRKRTRNPITVCHFPPGTSKWNKIEHRLFSFIAATTTEKGLEAHCELDENTCEKARKISNAEMAAINIHPHEFHGEWNYTIHANSSAKRSICFVTTLKSFDSRSPHRRVRSCKAPGH
ncbi:MAG: hypothetical protein HYV27_16240 [Candidatus Hydrogenedentes bacterium]|nr:hypothetical protein [Candidatus Hydrogenedentota bacterium]